MQQQQQQPHHQHLIPCDKDHQRKPIHEGPTPKLDEYFFVSNRGLSTE